MALSDDLDGTLLIFGQERTLEDIISFQMDQNRLRALGESKQVKYAQCIYLLAYLLRLGNIQGLLAQS